MTINLVVSDAFPATSRSQPIRPGRSRRTGCARLGIVASLLLLTSLGSAAPIIGPWIPKFQGVDYCVCSNITSTTDFPNQAVVHALRVDLTDPDVRLFTTPRLTTNYVANNREIGALTVSDFLRTNHLQAAINANFFSSRGYYLAAGTPMDVYGLQISEGTVVSAQTGSAYAAVLAFDVDNHPTFIPTNWPATSVDGLYTAVAGNYPLVVAGRNVISRTAAREIDPRTVFGLSEDRRFLYLVAIDGRQSGYSEGANDYESAGWLLQLGAYDGMNLDGGGSTTLVIEDSTGAPLRLNHPSAVADSGRERTVGSHFGMYAKPLSGFINDVLAQPEDTTAVITWTTTEPATSEVRYGTTTELDHSSGLEVESVTQHAVTLSALVPDTDYYYQIQATAGGQTHVSPLFHFHTAFYAVTNRVFDLDQTWKFTTTPMTGLGWTELGYDDSSWSGPGPGLLWVDVRATGPNPDVEPKVTEMPADPNNEGYPYVTYYFRTHFSLPQNVAGSTLHFAGFIDDGGIFYLNGAEIYRLRMPETVEATTLASGYPCEGDASCLDEFTIPADRLASLASGDNCLAVEIHNYNRRSADITFGVAMRVTEPIGRAPTLSIKSLGGSITLSWEGSGFVLQSANTPSGPWTDVGAATASPYVIAAGPALQFYRLRK